MRLSFAWNILKRQTINNDNRLPFYTEKNTSRKFSVSHNLAVLLMKFPITEVKYYFASPRSLL
jgi:hypothetical protein